MFLHLSISFLLGLASFSSVNSASASTPIASSILGKYKGTIIKNSFDDAIFLFRGIRYAEPPVGELRFKPAVPVKKHEGVHDATNDPPACPQPQLGNEPISEDCLFLNVYSKKLPTETDKVKKPVLVYIHSGDFQQFSSRSDFAGPEYLMNTDIVLVTFNYRLGVLGFISTGDKETPGNLGLKDQVEALRWIQKNIEGFGGDPNHVTIYGVGAGGIAVNLHLVSPLSKGLFHKSIISTGTATGIAPVGKSLLKLTKAQARIVGCPDAPTSSMIECLKKKPAEELGKSIDKLNPFPNKFALWKPVIEEDFGQERFLPDHPVKLMNEGKFHQGPILMGFNGEQFSDIALELVSNSQELEKFNKDFDSEAAKMFSYDHDMRAKLISKDLRSFYFGDKKIDNSTFAELTDMINDGLTGFEMYRAVTLLAERSKHPIFYYLYNFHGSYTHFYPKHGHSTNGPQRDDELIYIFYSHSHPKIGKDDPDFYMVQRINSGVERFITLDNYSNFKWPPYTLKDQKYLDNNKKVEVKERMNEKRFAEWNKLFPLTKYDIIQDSSAHI